jgi:hypothetical protein
VLRAQALYGGQQLAGSQEQAIEKKEDELRAAGWLYIGGGAANGGAAPSTGPKGLVDTRWVRVCVRLRQEEPAVRGVQVDAKSKQARRKAPTNTFLVPITCEFYPLKFFYRDCHPDRLGGAKGILLPGMPRKKGLGLGVCINWCGGEGWWRNNDQGHSAVGKDDRKQHRASARGWELVNPVANHCQWSQTPIDSQQEVLGGSKECVCVSEQVSGWGPRSVCRRLRTAKMEECDK